MTKLEHRKFADVSTIHMRLSDRNRLEELAAEYNSGRNAPLGASIVYSYAEGYFIYCGWPRENDKSEEVQDFFSLGFSSDFVHILDLANAQGMAYLQLDCDGEIYEDLPKFEWNEGSPPAPTADH